MMILERGWVPIRPFRWGRRRGHLLVHAGSSQGGEPPRALRALTARAAWPVWWSALFATLVLLAGAAQDHRSVAQRLEFAHARMAQTLAAVPAVAPSAIRVGDFTATLPVSPPTAAEVAALLHRHCKLAGAAMSEFTSSEQPATDSALGRREVDAEIVGSYAALKQALAQVLTSQAGSSLRTLRVRAEADGSTLRARATLVFWSAPATMDPGTRAAPSQDSRTGR